MIGGMSTPAELLRTHRPFLKYDSQENYFADSAAEWTDNPGNRLKNRKGDVLATAGNGLSLDFLGTTYPDGTQGRKTDLIGNPSRKYAQQARALHADKTYANQMYGHTVADGDELWLQYWFFYFYNDYNLIGPFIKAGLHEGDWEMIQIHLVAGTPDRAVYAQHSHWERRDWRQVDLLPGTKRPIVYVARGSHASYFEPGTQWTGHWFDHADGKRKSPEIALIEVDETDPAFGWIRWPGRWGDTRKGSNPLDSPSPVGPGMKNRWDDPGSIDGDARAQARAAAGPEGPPPLPPSPPRITAEWHGDTIRIDYEVFATRGEWPDGLVVTVNSPDEAAPPTTERFDIAGEHTGSVDITVPVDPAHRYDVFVSVATPDALSSDSVRVDLAPR
jgi:hypothetical protein